MDEGTAAGSATRSVRECGPRSRWRRSAAPGAGRPRPTSRSRWPLVHAVRPSDHEQVRHAGNLQPPSRHTPWRWALDAARTSPRRAAEISAPPVLSDEPAQDGADSPSTPVRYAKIRPGSPSRPDHRPTSSATPQVGAAVAQEEEVGRPSRDAAAASARPRSVAPAQLHAPRERQQRLDVRLRVRHEAVPPPPNVRVERGERELPQLVPVLREDRLEQLQPDVVVGRATARGGVEQQDRATGRAGARRLRDVGSDPRRPCGRVPPASRPREHDGRGRAHEHADRALRRTDPASDAVRDGRLGDRAGRDPAHRQGRGHVGHVVGQVEGELVLLAHGHQVRPRRPAPRGGASPARAGRRPGRTRPRRPRSGGRGPGGGGRRCGRLRGRARSAPCAPPGPQPHSPAPARTQRAHVRGRRGGAARRAPRAPTRSRRRPGSTAPRRRADAAAASLPAAAGRGFAPRDPAPPAPGRRGSRPRGARTRSAGPCRPGPRTARRAAAGRIGARSPTARVLRRRRLRASPKTLS